MRALMLLTLPAADNTAVRRVLYLDPKGTHEASRLYLCVSVVGLFWLVPGGVCARCASKCLCAGRLLGSSVVASSVDLTADVLYEYCKYNKKEFDPREIPTPEATLAASEGN